MQKRPYIRRWEARKIEVMPLVKRVARALAIDCRDLTNRVYGDKVEQEIAEGCRRLIKNVIICWNYLYLTQKIAEEQDAARRQELLAAVQHGSVVSWRHINLHGEYDFSDERLQDSVGLRWPNDPTMRISQDGGHTKRNAPYAASDSIL